MWIGARMWLREYSCAGYAKSTYQLQLQFLLLLSLSSFFMFSSSSSSSSSNHYPSPCGDMLNISCPFYFNGDVHRNCNHHKILSQELHCQNNRTVIDLRGDSDQSYMHYVADIDYTSNTVRLIDTHKNQRSIPLLKVSSDVVLSNMPVFFIDCSASVASYPQFSADSGSLIFDVCSSYLDKNYCPGQYSYIVAGPIVLPDVADGCRVSDAALVSNNWRTNITHNHDFIGISQADDDNIYSEVLAYGFDVSWKAIFCSRTCKPDHICELDEELHAFKCQPWATSSRKDRATTRRLLAALIPLGFMFVLGVLFMPNIMGLIQQRKEDALKIKMFMENYRALKPTRYSYSDIKKITNMFKHELGQGGYGSVFKGQISSDIIVAVKVLHNDSKENGDDFINEVSTIGKIHHVNVVRLLGYCADGCNRALVYEFQPNHSLEKFVYRREKQQSFIGWKKMQKIALGVAKGIKYLHEGCAQQILHFDIKPNNILLDQTFNPKISDFGLAKLCNKGQSIVSMTAARGTIGYIAPEVFLRNFGNVSTKSDVYSFGMLLLEMVGEKNNDVEGEQNTSEVYFPEWIFHRLEKGGELVIQIENEDDSKIARKLTIVGLWCIGWHPIDRPSMKLVIQMLEADECPVIPPKSFSSTTSENAKSFFSERLQDISETE